MLEDENSKKVKIIDFGTSKLLEPGQKYQNIAGTPEFMAPEVVNYDDITTLTGRGSLVSSVSTKIMLLEFSTLTSIVSHFMDL